MFSSVSKSIKWLVILFFVCFAGCGGGNGGEQPAKPKTRVACVEIELTDRAPKIEISATVEYTEISELSCEVSGLIESANFEEGQSFSKGAALIRLNSDLLEKSIAAAEAELGEAIHEYDLQKWDFERIDALLKSGDISEKQHRDKTAAYQKSIKDQERLKAQLESLQSELSKKTIKAPYNCTIIKKAAFRGEWASPGKTLAIVGNSDYVYVCAQAPENLLEFLNIDTELDFQIGVNKLRGKIFSMNSGGDRNSRTFPIKIKLKNDIGLKSGMEGRVWLPAGKQRSSYFILREALVFRGKETFIFAAVNGKAEQLPVSVINYEDLYAEIRSANLADGMNIIVKGNQYLKPGEDVEIVKSDKTSPQ